MFNLFVVGLGLAAAQFAPPELTTVQDTLYKADGTRFNGTIQIEWSSFETANLSKVMPQSLTTRVTDGFLRVRLIPTTNASPASYYSVKYNSDGRIQFEETWAVPPSPLPLRVRDVRIGSISNSPTVIAVQQGDVVGLIAELSARPVKGAGYAGGRAAVINMQGALEAAIGSPSDCVRVDGSAGPCGDAAGFVDTEALSGLVDGANASFMLTAAPAPASSLHVYRNGILQKSGFDYNATGATVQFVAQAVPQPGDTLLASYRTAGGEGGAGSGSASGMQVICSGSGSATASDEWAAIGSCAIPSGTLSTGDRIDVRFEVENAGEAAPFEFAIAWGATEVVRRPAGAADRYVSGRADASITATGAQLSGTSWGTELGFATGAGFGADAPSAGVMVEVRARTTAPGSGQVRLNGLTVMRYPAK